MNAQPAAEQLVVAAVVDGVAETGTVHLPAPHGRNRRPFNGDAFPPASWPSACGSVDDGHVYNLAGLRGAQVCQACEQTLAAPKPEPEPLTTRTRAPAYTAEQVEAALLRFQEEHGRQPTFADIKDCDYLPRPGGAVVWSNAAVRLGWPDPAAPKRAPRPRRALLEPPGRPEREPQAAPERPPDAGSLAAPSSASSRPDLARALIAAGRAFLNTPEKELGR